MAKVEARGMVLRIQAAAEYLGVSVCTMYRYAGKGEVPAFRLGGQWRFHRDELDDWMKKESRRGMVRRG